MKEKLKKVVQMIVLVLIILLAGIASLMIAGVGVHMMNASSTIMAVLGGVVLICSMGLFAAGLFVAHEFLDFIDRKNEQ